MDLAGTFNLMDFHHSAARPLAFELTGGLSVIHTTGMFGWTGTPYVFQCITRVLCKLSRRLITGDCDWCVDDSMGISPTTLVREDLTIVVDTKLVLIGWLVDAVRMTFFFLSLAHRLGVINYIFYLNRACIPYNTNAIAYLHSQSAYR
jgi:hypothetical protein